MRRFPLVLFGALLLLNVSLCSAQIFHKKKVDKSTDSTNTAEPDKQLYDRALLDIKKGRHEQGRLELQTLINTYPDSEFLAKAKLAIGDSYYKEGGTSNTMQAIAAYKDFGVFFPFLPEAAYAQLQVAKAHYNEMTKADRDNTQAKAAEEEFQTFLLKFPNDPLAPEAQQRLREVQEVLAEAQFRIGYYYYLKGDKRAAAGRLLPLTLRYPLYSKSDEALWMLGDIYEKSERKDFAGAFYTKLVRYYPLSNHAPDAAAKLKSFGAPVPQADPQAKAWMTAEQNAPRPKETLIHRGFSLLHPGPDVHTAALSGAPNMEPENDNVKATDILRGASKTTTLTATQAGSNSVVEKVAVGETAPASSTTEDTATGTTSGSTPSGSTSSDTTTTTTDAPPADNKATSASGVATPDTPMDKSAQAAAPPADGSTASTSTDGSNTTSTDNSNGKESSSKKKGLRKLLPW